MTVTYVRLTAYYRDSTGAPITSAAPQIGPQTAFTDPQSGTFPATLVNCTVDSTGQLLGADGQPGILVATPPGGAIYVVTNEPANLASAQRVTLTYPDGTPYQVSDVTPAGPGTRLFPVLVSNAPTAKISELVKGGQGGVPGTIPPSGSGVVLTQAAADARYLQTLSGAYAPTSQTQVGAPTTGTHVVGEVFVDSNGAIWCCSIAGTPGTWFAAGSGVELASADLSADPALATTTVTDVAGLSITFVAPARPFVIDFAVPLVGVSTASAGVFYALTDSANTAITTAAVYPLSTGSFGSGFCRARLPRTGTGAYPITPGTSYTFKIRQSTTAGTGATDTLSGVNRPILRAVTC